MERGGVRGSEREGDREERCQWGKPEGEMGTATGPLRATVNEIQYDSPGLQCLGLSH